MAPLKLFTGTVLRSIMVTPGMIRVTLGGAGLRELETTGVGDEYIRLFFPDLETGELVLPEVNERGQWKYPEGKKPAHCECYTVRYFRPGEIDLDFVIHAHGRASEWARSAQPGDQIMLRQPYAIYEAPAGTDWVLFVCDATGLPALGRLLEQLPAGIEARAIVEVPDASHEQAFDTRASLKLVWLHGAGNGIAPSRLEEVVRTIPFPADRLTYAWVAAESRAVRPIRRYMRHELGWSPKQYSVTGYWTDNVEAWTAGWQALDPKLRQRIDDMWVSGRDREDVADEVEAIMEKFGL
jgi:NADPH-dependent ferric siderophore reductase